MGIGATGPRRAAWAGVVRTVTSVVLLVACSPAVPPAPDAPPPTAPTPEPAAPPPVLAPPAVPTPAAEALPPAAPEEVLSAEDRRAAEEFGTKFLSAIRDGDDDAIRAAFDVDAIVEAVCEGVKTTPKMAADFRTGLRAGLCESIVSLAAQWRDHSPTFKRVVRRDGASWVRFRFTGEDGIGIVDLRLRRSPRGLAIDDFLNQSIGFELVEGTRQASMPMLASLDRGLLDRLVKGRGTSVRDMEAFGRLGKQIAAGDSEGALATWASIPAELQDTLAATTLHIAALQKSDDDAGYARALQRAAERFPPPHFRFALVDAHYIEKRYDRAVVCIDEFMAAVERDAAVLALRALLLEESGDVAAAHATLLEAFALEFDCRYAHEKGLDVLLAAKDHARTRDSIRFLESCCGLDFHGNLEGALWADFVAAPESEPWR